MDKPFAFVEVGDKAFNVDQIEEWGFHEETIATEEDVAEGEAPKVGFVFPARLYLIFASGRETSITGKGAERYSQALYSLTYAA